MSRVVTGFIEPVTAKGLMKKLSKIADAKRRQHQPLLSPIDYQHPLVQTLVARMPGLSYHELEAVKSYLETHDSRATTNARHVYAMLCLVNEELLKRDDEREAADKNFVGWLTTKGILQ